MGDWLFESLGQSLGGGGWGDAVYTIGMQAKQASRVCVINAVEVQAK